MRFRVVIEASAPDTDYALAELAGWVSTALEATDRSVVVQRIEVEDADPWP